MDDSEREGGDCNRFDRMEPKFSPASSCSSDGSTGVNGVGCGYIEHHVSKMDTLAGVAIKYGVEVADIKRLNGLVTDLQMFALKSLQIPLPGRHPPSPELSNGLDARRLSSSEQTPSPHRHSDFFESFQSLKLNSSSPQGNVSAAMRKLQGYYALKSTDQQRDASEGFEMSVYREGGSHYLEDGPFAKPFPLSYQPLDHYSRRKSLANGFLSENHKAAIDVSTAETRNGEPDKWSKNLFRRCEKSEADFSSCTREMLLKEHIGSGGGFSATKGKGLALRPKAANRSAVGVDAEAGSVPFDLGDSFVSDSLSAVRKSSSTPSLPDEETSTSSSFMWPSSRWSLKPDLQGFSSAAIAKPIFDGFPKSMTGRRNKAALD